MRPLIWVSKSLEKLAAALTEMGHPIGPDTVRKELVKLGFSRQSNRKADEGSHHLDRNAQFEYINTKVVAAQARQQPVISVDTKKKELIGNFRNGGTDYRPKGDPLRVSVHDFEDKKLGKVRALRSLRCDRQCWICQRRDHERHRRVRCAVNPLLARSHGTSALPTGARVDDHGRLWRLEWRAGAALEGGVAKAR